jgi:thiosulfate dehydrogenase (quinone) large subunit
MPPRSSVRSDRAARRRDRPWADGRPPAPGPGPGPAEGDAGGSGLRVFRALLPLRFFLGATFVYAGLDKVVDPHFLHDTGPGSIGEQLVGFTHVSPLAPLIQLTALQAPVLIGFLIALAEIAIGLAALTGLLYRLAAAGGFALSVMFWLTASWATKPYYYGPDLPYALGWLTIGLAGHGGLYVLDGAWDRWAGRRIVRARYGDFVPPAEVDAWTADPGRRGFLQVALLGSVAVGLAGAFGLLGHRHALVNALGLGGSGETPRPGATGSGPPSVGGAGTPADSPSPTPLTAGGTTPAASSDAGTPAATPSGKLIGQVDQVKGGRAVAFQVPSTGDPAYLIRLPDGKIVAYDAVCTHAGCTVDFDRGSGLLVCPCHGATFDPGHNARPIAGPTDVPLAKLPIRVDAATGRITLTG